MAYPRDPSWKAAGTSQDASEAITSHAKTVRDRVLAFLRWRYPTSFTADQIAAGLNENILTVSELRRSSMIEPTEERRKNKSGMFAQCWRAKVTP